VFATAARVQCCVSAGGVLRRHVGCTRWVPFSTDR
jgi:hypothetical protein